MIIKFFCQEGHKYTKQIVCLNLTRLTLLTCRTRRLTSVISNKCVNRSAVWVQNRLKLGYETTGYLLKDALRSKRLEFLSIFSFFFNRYFKLVNFLSLIVRDSGSFLCFPLKFLSRKLLGGWHH